MNQSKDLAKITDNGKPVLPRESEPPDPCKLLRETFERTGAPIHEYQLAVGRIAEAGISGKDFDKAFASLKTFLVVEWACGDPSPNCVYLIFFHLATELNLDFKTLNDPTATLTRKGKS